MPRFKAKLADPDARLVVCLCTIPSPVVTQALAGLVDGVVVDMEHGAVGYPEAHAMMAATAGTDCAPMVRVSSIDPAEVKRVLDLGAEGIIFPLIRTVEDAKTAIASMAYPPDGIRGFGPFIAHSRWGTDLLDYPGVKEPDLVCVLTIETREAVENIDAICALPGIDMIVPAPFDLSTELGHMGDFAHPEVQSAMSRVFDAARAQDLPVATLARSAEDAQALFAKGYRAIAGFDILWLKSRAAEISAWTRPQDQGR